LDRRVARAYADIAALAGRGLPIPDGYIAATAVVHGYAVATRDTAPFAAAGVHVINPWTA
jgi:predicted nucleic acid-binding protein